MYKHIMLPLEGDALSAKAINECFALAKQIGAKVTVLHVVPHSNLHAPVGFTHELISGLRRQREADGVRHGEQMLSALEANADCAGVEYDNLVVVGDSPYEEILDKAAEHDCDLIMMASHGRSGL
ncbi:MAG TPA: universal stress protein, partial [Burkholderiales bacterium]|nr:universal stress protein [Burkholderiales bacterium]